ncbi:MAG: MFS transporter [bacterium]|nr:MFS transporter [bacterium]
MHPIFRTFAVRNYRIYWTGFTISLVGSWMQTLAQSWLVWDLTRSAFWLGMVGALSQLPSLILGSIGGVLVDRTVKRRLLIITQSGLALSALALAVVTLSGVVRVEHVVVIAAITGIFTAADSPARLSFVSEIVGKEYLGNAIALNSTTFNAARLIGPSIAGLLIPIIGTGGCFLVNSLSFLAMIFALMMMRDLPAPVFDTSTSVVAQWREAFRYVMRARVPRALILNVAVFSAFSYSYVVLMPVFADVILESGVRGMGAMMGAVGVGALAGGIWQAALSHKARRGRVVIFGAFTLCVSLLLFSFSRSLLLSILILPLVGLASISMLASTNTLLQTLAPDHLRGRVLGFYTTAFMGIMPIGSMIVGAVAAEYGAPHTIAAGAVVCLIVASLTLARNKRLMVV